MLAFIAPWLAYSGLLGRNYNYPQATPACCSFIHYQFAISGYPDAISFFLMKDLYLVCSGKQLFRAVTPELNSIVIDPARLSSEFLLFFFHDSSQPSISKTYRSGLSIYLSAIVASNHL